MIPLFSASYTNWFFVIQQFRFFILRLAMTQNMVMAKSRRIRGGIYDGKRGLQDE